MAVWETIRGKYIDLVTADSADAQFTLEIRNDPELTKYIPVINSTVENQKKWIARQREKDFDVFFVMKKHNGDPIGTLSFYDYVENERSCEIGRYISHGNAYENIEAVLLMLDRLFGDVCLSRIMLNIHEQNQPVISLWKRFGAKFNKREDMGGWFSAQYFLYKEDYLAQRDKIAKLLKY